MKDKVVTLRKRDMHLCSWSSIWSNRAALKTSEQLCYMLL